MMSVAAPSPSSLCFIKPFSFNKALCFPLYNKPLHKRKRRNGICRAELSMDAPIGAAIGATILYSLVFPVTYEPPAEDGDESNSMIDSADARFAVMGIISFIPFFNWLSWLFAWLDTGKQRYAIYAIVYLAPYLRANFSISPDESWLPISSIILCIIHIQLEASIKNGDVTGLGFLNELQNRFSSGNRENHESSDKKRFENYLDSPSAREQSKTEIQNWRVPRNPSQESETLNNDEKADEGRDH